VIVKTPAASEQAPPGRAGSERAPQDFRDAASAYFVVMRLVSVDKRVEKRKDIVCPATLRKKHFQACPRGLDRFDKNEFVLVRKDHDRS
jgi:hypothetical protein